MVKEKLLYIVGNDGSDTRVVKEVKTLSLKYDIYFIGINKKISNNYVIDNIKESFFVAGSHKSLFTIIKLNLKVLKLLKTNIFSKVHIIDEQFFVFFIFILFRQNVTLDLFDSYFLKLSKPNEDLLFFKNLIYYLPQKIIVTDENRYDLMPEFVKKKLLIIPNVPFYKDYKNKDYSIRDSNFLIICYFGSLHKDRGSDFLINMLNQNTDIKVLAAGWINDKLSNELIKHERVKYLGVLKQQEANTVLNSDGDYLLSIYPANNTNNINASPNKLYDSIQTKTPLIINRNIKVSKFVSTNNTGYIIDDMSNIDYKILKKELILNLKKYKFSNNLSQKYCWENYEQKLLNL